MSAVNFITSIEGKDADKAYDPTLKEFGCFGNTT